MEEEFWLKCGLKENGEITCVRVLSNSRPNELFYYTEDGKCKEVKNTVVLKLTKELIEKIK